MTPSSTPWPDGRAAGGAASRMSDESAGAVVLVAAVLLAFLPSLGGGFLWDDDIWITSVARTPTQRLIHDDGGQIGRAHV